MVNLNKGLKQGIAKATKDVRQALLFLLHHNDKLQLDLDNVILAGASSGAFMATFLGAAQNCDEPEKAFTDSIRIAGVVNIMGGGLITSKIDNYILLHAYSFL